MDMKLRYCLECGRIVPVMVGVDGFELHTKLIYLGVDLPEVDVCYGPFAMSTPPENFDENWDLDLNEPSQEELAEMNLNAEILLQELEG